MEAIVAHTACRNLTNYQVSESRQKARTSALFRARFWAQTLLRLCWRQRCEPPGRDARLLRKDVLREAATSLSLDLGAPFTAREYQLLEQLWRTDP
jgi:hypothetical protein